MVVEEKPPDVFDGVRERIPAPFHHVLTTWAIRVLAAPDPGWKGIHEVGIEFFGVISTK
jgi:hypothetical protein